MASEGAESVGEFMTDDEVAWDEDPLGEILRLSPDGWSDREDETEDPAVAVRSYVSHLIRQVEALGGCLRQLCTESEWWVAGGILTPEPCDHGRDANGNPLKPIT